MQLFDPGTSHERGHRPRDLARKQVLAIPPPKPQWMVVPLPSRFLLRPDEEEDESESKIGAWPADATE
jgi:hypothetical protein